MTASRDWITLGMTCSVTGRYSHPGGQVLAGVQAWIEDTNRGGGMRVDGRRPVRLIHYDDASKTERCAGLVQSLIERDRVDLLLGPYSSGLATAAARVAGSHGRVLWNHGGALDGINDAGGGWVVSVLSPAGTYFHGVIALVRETRTPLRSVAIVHSAAGAFPKEVAAGAEEYCLELGIGPVAVHRYEAGDVDFQTIVRLVGKERPDLLLGVGRIGDDIRLAQASAAAGTVAGAVALVATPLALFKDALGDSAEGLLGPSQWEPGIVAAPDYGPSSRQVMESLRAQHSPAVDYPMAQAYAGCLVAQRCIEETGSLDGAALRGAAAELDFTTFYGRFRIDAAGRQVGHRMPVVQWRGEEKVVGWPREFSSGSVE